MSNNGNEGMNMLLDYLKEQNAPGEILEMLEGLLKRVERAEYLLREKGIEPAPADDLVSVEMPAMDRKPFTRVVQLKEYSIFCPHCQSHKTFKRYPGPPPAYCPDCKIEIDRLAKKQSQEKWRAKGKVARKPLPAAKPVPAPEEKQPVEIPLQVKTDMVQPAEINWQSLNEVQRQALITAYLEGSVESYNDEVDALARVNPPILDFKNRFGRKIVYFATERGIQLIESAENAHELRQQKLFQEQVKMIEPFRKKGRLANLPGWEQLTDVQQNALIKAYKSKDGNIKVYGEGRDKEIHLLSDYYPLPIWRSERQPANSPYVLYNLTAEGRALVEANSASEKPARQPKKKEQPAKQVEAIVEIPLTEEKPRYWVGKYPASKYQADIFDEVIKMESDILVVAAAGSAKSTTMVEAIRLLIKQGVPAAQIATLAFNVHIHKALQSALKNTRVNVSTIHSAGFRALKKPLGLNENDRADGRKYGTMAGKWVENEIIYSKSLRDKDEKAPIWRSQLKEMCEFARLTLTDYRDPDALQAMAKRYKLINNKFDEWVIHGVRPILDEGERLVREEKVFDFTDMIWIPYKWDLPTPEYQFIAIDEAQDLNALQRKFVLRLRANGGRMLFVGDPKQSIMGFAGADVESFYEIQKETNAKMMPLSVSYRCPKSHVREAQDLVPTIEAAPNAIEGKIEVIKEEELLRMAQAQDMIICRRTAPLVDMAYRFISQGKAARVRGQDGFSKNLVALVDQIVRFSKCTFNTFESGMNKFLEKETARLEQRENGGNQLETIRDKCRSILAIYKNSEASDLKGFTKEIEALFEDAHAAIILSTVHRAKGLEADRVFILHHDAMPMSWDNQEDWEFEQELNIKYVALTRSKRELYLIPQPPKKKDKEESTGRSTRRRR